MDEDFDLFHLLRVFFRFEIAWGSLFFFFFLKYSFIGRFGFLWLYYLRFSFLNFVMTEFERESSKNTFIN